jgi:coenzyme Q-binding protein COQ10
MPVFRAHRRVFHSAKDMFDLVADVERYPTFVPLCERHVIRSRTKCGETELLTTDMTVAYKIFRETIRSRVTLDRASGRIVVQAVDGPLRELETRWTFQAREADSCDVGFYLCYELASRTLALLMGAVFDAAFARFVEAFQRRADIVYGRRLAAGVRSGKAQGPLRHRQYGACETASAHSAMHPGKRAAS